MKEWKVLSVEEFAACTAGSAPVPGGGSVAALAGALAAALSEMVANLTIGREKYAKLEQEMRQLSESGAQIRKELIEGIRKDSTSFCSYMEALKLPRETEEEKKIRKEAMQQGLKEASEAPLAIAETAARIFPIAEAVVLRGNAVAVSDGLISAMLARTALLSALLNVRMNLSSIQDEDYTGKMELRVSELMRLAIQSEQRILELSPLTRRILQEETDNGEGK